MSFVYLQIIGVASENQGKGHGGKLLKELLVMTDEAKLPIYLETETESNVRFLNLCITRRKLNPNKSVLSRL